MISKLIKNQETRESYIRSKLSVLLPAQIRSLRLRREMKQAELGTKAKMKQARISVLEHIGEASYSIETLIKLASAFRVGLMVKFVPMSEMLEWENSFMPDEFDAVPLERDKSFLRPKHVNNQANMSSGLRDAMLGDQDNSVNVIPAYTVQSESALSRSQASIDKPGLPTSVALNSQPSKGQMNSASLCSALNLDIHEQGRAA
jgi:transcriptional regulator with XRE-family HTH domain